MLTGTAQPTSAFRHAAGVCLRAAGSLAAAIAAMFVLLLPLPVAAASAENQRGAWPWPLLGEVITPYKNGSDPYAAGQHRGLDIAAPVGTPVLAIVEGRVSFSGKLPDGSQVVTLRSSNGQWLISSLHLASRSVHSGQPVRSGNVIGRVGESGPRSAEQPHLHLSVRRAASGEYVDPASLLQSPQALASGRPKLPKIEAIERPASALKNVRAHTTGGSSSVTRHGAHEHRTAVARSAGENAREGDAADGISRVAPPPISERAEPLTQGEALQHAARQQVQAAEPVRADSTENAGTGTRHRLLLIAIAAICLIALALRRKPRNPAPEIDHAPEGTGSAEVIPMDHARRSA